MSEKGPIFFCLNQIYKKLKKYNRLDILKKNPNDKKEKIDIKELMNKLVIYGDTIEVKDKILELKSKFNNMKTLTYVNVDWQDTKITKKSMQLLSEKVIEKIN